MWRFKNLKEFFDVVFVAFILVGTGTWLPAWFVKFRTNQMSKLIT